MAEKHQKTTITSVGDIMYAIYTMVTTSGQTAVQWADTAGASNGSRAIYSGSAFIAASAVTSTTFNSTSSYMVIESTAAMPSSRRWQAKISRGAANANLYVNFAPRGSWNYATPGFDTTNYPYTGDIDCLSNNTTAAGRVLVSTSDLDTYGSGTTYSYLRFMLWDGTAIVKSMYVGGYIPFDQTNNTNPAVVFTRSPFWNTASNGTWGSTSTGAVANFNRISPDYTGATKSLAAAGYAHIKAIDTTIVNRDPNANWVNFPVYIRCVDDASFFGYFGKYTMFAGDTSRSLCTADSNNEYLVVNDLVMRWKPSA